MPLGQVEALSHNGAELAFERQSGKQPTFLWLGGFRSDMSGSKAQALAEWAARSGQAFVRFDYSGHGRSGGAFQEGSIGHWLSDALAVVDRLTQGPVALVGSSMGAWIALLIARARPERAAALLLIAPAADFTERLMWPSLSPAARKAILTEGRWEQPSAYDPEPTVITRRMIEDGREHLVMDAPIAFAGPVRILQGGRDPDVPEAHARALADLIGSPDLRFELIEDGDHRLSRPQDLERLMSTAEQLRAQLAA